MMFWQKVASMEKEIKNSLWCAFSSLLPSYCLSQFRVTKWNYRVFSCLVMYVFLNFEPALSHWCIDHQENAKQVVETWDKFFNSSRRKQRVPLLYLANDIIQTGRRKENWFVNRFWKVLPRAVKDVYENGDDEAKNAVAKLVRFSYSFHEDPCPKIPHTSQDNYRQG